MKTRYILLALLLMWCRLPAQQMQQQNKSVLQYLVQKVLLPDREKGKLIVVPLRTEDIKHHIPGQEVQYWRILQKYFPDATRDSLQKIVIDAPWIGKVRKIKRIKLVFPELPTDQPQEISVAAIVKKYHYPPVCAVSNIVYSPDGNTCILHVSGYDYGTFTLEIKKDASGKWASHIMSTDWLT